MDRDSCLTTEPAKLNGGSSSEQEAWDVIVVGAGISGVAAAHRLTSHGLRILVLEGGSRVGGRIWTEWTGMTADRVSRMSLLSLPITE